MPAFQQAHDFSITGSTFNDYSVNNSSGIGPLVYLQQFVASGAAHDSHERFPPPQCHPATRERVLRVILAWAKLPQNERLKRVLWLHAPAGMGKSAIAQTVAEQCDELDILAATFFFHRLDPKRNRAERLVASIVLQLCESIPELVQHVEAVIQSTPTILTKSLPIQLKRLIIDPMHKITPMDEDRVVIIDGLDECVGAEPNRVDPAQEQLLILQLIDTLVSSDLPLCLLICCRPESWLKDGFQSLARLWARVADIDLCQHSDMDADIETYFCSEFTRIRERSSVAASWPSTHNLKTLIYKASGQFIYAATVIRYIDDPWGTPTDRLDVILSADMPADHNPLQALDNLYLAILTQCPNRELTLEVLGCLKVCVEACLLGGISSTWPAPAHMLEAIRHWPRQALRGLHSLVRINGKATEAPFFHATFCEFLASPVRSKSFHIPPYHCLQLLGDSCLLYLESQSRTPLDWDTPFDVIAFASQCWINSWTLYGGPSSSARNSSPDVLDAFLSYDFRFSVIGPSCLYGLELGLWLKLQAYGFSPANLAKVQQCVAHLNDYFYQHS